MDQLLNQTALHAAGRIDFIHPFGPITGTLRSLDRSDTASRKRVRPCGSVIAMGGPVVRRRSGPDDAVTREVPASDFCAIRLLSPGLTAGTGCLLPAASSVRCTIPLRP